MAQHLFTSGEFAHICGIRKDTLLYYDSIGLLPPELVAPNGYRYYSTKQFYTYHIISTLKEAGASLEEICNYLRNQTTQDFLRFRQKQQELSARTATPATHAKTACQYYPHYQAGTAGTGWAGPSGAFP